MKKIISLIIAISCLVAFAACDKNTGGEIDMSEVMETAETVYEVTGNAGSISIDESVAMTLLEIYPQEDLGLSVPIDEYELKLSATRFMDDDACLVEAYAEGAETPEGTYIILGQQCFVYSAKRQDYLLLTPEGVVKYDSEKAENSEETATTDPVFVYDKENNKKLQERFAPYGKEALGLDKEISEYVLVASGTTTTAENGETVYVVRIHEKTGEATNKTVAFNDNGNYIFDYEVSKYKKL